MKGRFTTPAASSRCDYFRPVTVDDVIRQVAFVSHTGTSSQSSDHHFLLEDGTQVAAVRITRVVVDGETGKPAPIQRVLDEAPDSDLAQFLRAAAER